MGYNWGMHPTIWLADPSKDGDADATDA